MAKINFLIIVLFLLIVVNVNGQENENKSWSISDKDINLNLPTIINNNEKHKVEIVRQFNTDAELMLIKKAEAVYPKREMVANKINTAHFKLDNIPQEEYLWWYSEFDGVR